MPQTNKQPTASDAQLTAGLIFPGKVLGNCLRGFQERGKCHLSRERLSERLSGCKMSRGVKSRGPIFKKS